MPRAERPSAPSDDLAARRAWRGPTFANGLLTPEIVAFCQSGLSIVVAACLDRRPVAGRALACRVDPSGTIRVLLRQSSNAALLAALRQGGDLALTFTRPATHRSIQLKGPGARPAAPSPADATAAVAQSAGFRAELIDVGYSVSFATAYCAFEPADLAVVDFLPEHAFAQTPGPGAGSALA